MNVRGSEELYLGWDPRKLWVSLGEPDFCRISGLGWIPTVKVLELALPLWV